jgi:hypothetical protein
MPYPTPNISSVRGRIIMVSHPDADLEKSYLTSAASAGALALVVADNGGLSVNDWLRVGQVGSDTCELTKVNAAVSRGTALTVTALKFSHDPSEPVEHVLFDQLKIYGNTTNTTVGATLIGTIDQTPNQDFTEYENTGAEFAYYFVLEHNSDTAVDSDAYSDGVTATGYAEDTAGSIIERALEEVGARGNDKITYQWSLNQINDCLKDVRRKLKTWSFVQSFGSVIGQTVTGVNEIVLPSDIGDANSAKSILNVYLDGHDEPLQLIDREEKIREYGTMVSTQVRTQATAGDLTIAVDNSYGFPDSGSLTFWISGVEYTITYTGVTRSATAGVLTGVPAAGSDGAITVTIPVDTNVWYGPQVGEPAYFEVSDGSIRLYPLPDSNHDDLNVRMDYYTDRTAVDSLSDVIDTKAYDMVLHWVKWKMRGAMNALGADDLNDTDFLQYRDILNQEVRRETSGQKRGWTPKINRITY